MRNIFSLSIEKRIYPDQLKIAHVTPLFKKGGNVLMDNYLPIISTSLFFPVLQKQHSTDHMIVHLVTEILKPFENP